MRVQFRGTSGGARCRPAPTRQRAAAPRHGVVTVGDTAAWAAAGCASVWEGVLVSSFPHSHPPPPLFPPYSPIPFLLVLSLLHGISSCPDRPPRTPLAESRLPGTGCEPPPQLLQQPLPSTSESPPILSPSPPESPSHPTFCRTYPSSRPPRTAQTPGPHPDQVRVTGPSSGRGLSDPARPSRDRRTVAAASTRRARRPRRRTTGKEAAGHAMTVTVAAVAAGPRRRSCHWTAHGHHLVVKP
jgi:hypothetical protein